jgi:glyoxylase-like metal-dependent hydrolase (beta-lactamase superfamily II)
MDDVGGGATPVAKGVWRITTPLPYRPGEVHAYLAELDGGGWMLVDGGIASDAAWSTLDGGVRAVAGGWGEVRLHVATHMHLDHLGLAPLVGRASGAALAMGELDARRAAHAARDPAEEAEYRRALLRRCGAPTEEVERLAGGRGSAAPAGAEFRAATLELRCGVAPLPGAEGWLSLWTPGHTAGHVSLYRERDRLLVAGDAILPGITPTIGVNRQREDPVGDYLDTLERLRALEPALALCGHGAALTDPLARIAELEAATRAETERVRAALDAGACTAWEVVERLYAGRKLPPSIRMLALRETLAHMEHLEGGRRRTRLSSATPLSS